MKSVIIILMIILTGCASRVYEPNCTDLALYAAATIREYPTRIVTYHPVGAKIGVNHAQTEVYRDGEWRPVTVERVPVMEGFQHFEIDKNYPVTYWYNELNFAKECVWRFKK